MYLLPKDLFIKGNLLYNKFKNKNINELNEKLITEYYKLQKNLLEYTKKYLTTVNMAKYILDKTNHTNVKKILYLSGRTDPDYLRCLTLHGFKILFGKNCHDFPKIPHIYKSDKINYKKLYGKGITYTNLIIDDLHDNNLDVNLEESIKQKKFDIIIYGSYHRGMPFYELVCKKYDADEIILLCGEDIHNCNYNKFINKGHHVFVREL